jgi:hypothetical protein
MNKLSILKVVAFIGAVFAGSVFLSNSIHGDVPGAQKKYHVSVGIRSSEIEAELNKQAAAGWKFEQASAESNSGTDLIFSQQ